MNNADGKLCIEYTEG